MMRAEKRLERRQSFGDDAALWKQQTCGEMQCLAIIAQ